MVENFTQIKKAKNFNNLIKIISLLISVSILWLIISRGLQSNIDKKTIKNCVEEEVCEGRNAALERLIVRGYVLYNSVLSGINLKATNLEGGILNGSDFSQSNLSNTNFQKAHLTKANMEKANLSSVNFQKALLNRVNMKNANLTNANLKNAKLYNASLDEVNLVKSNLEGASLYESNFTNSQIKTACNWQTAFYKGKFIHGLGWQLEKEANRKFINQLQKDIASDPAEKVDCSKWKN